MSNKFKYIILIIISHWNIANAQLGKYCAEDFLWSKCLELLPDNKFESEELMCVAQIVGKGNYEFKKDSIIFSYEPIDFFENQFRIIKDDQAVLEKIRIKFDVRDYENQEMIDTVYALCLNENYIQNKDVKPLEIISKEFPILIEIYAEGYSSYRFQIFENGNYSVNVDLMKDIFRDSYEAATGTESFKIIGEIGKTMILSNDIFIDNLEFKRSNTQSNNR